LLGVISPMRIQVPSGRKCDLLSLIPARCPAWCLGNSGFSVMFVE